MDKLASFDRFIDEYSHLKTFGLAKSRWNAIFVSVHQSNLNLLSIFRTNQEFIGIFVIPFILLFLGTAWWGVPIQNPDVAFGPIGDLFQTWSEKHPLANLIVVGSSLLITSFWLNIIIIRTRLNKEFNLFPGIFLVLISLAISVFKPMSILAVSNLFFLFALSQSFSIYKKANAASNIFNIGFWIGVASLLYSPFIFFLLWGFFTLNTIRTGSTRETLIMLSGTMVVYFLAATCYYYADNLEAFTGSIIDSFGFVSWPQTPSTNDWILIASFAILLFIVLASFRSYQVKKSMEVQKKISSLYYALLATVFAFIFQANPSAYLFLLMAIPLAILLAFSATDLSTSLGEIVFIIVILGLFGLHYGAFIL